MEGFYRTQQANITKRASETGIPSKELDAYFERKLEEVQKRYPGRALEYILGRTEYLVWEHYFPSEPFPSKMGDTPVVKKQEGRNQDTLRIKKEEGEIEDAQRIKEGEMKSLPKTISLQGPPPPQRNQLPPKPKLPLPHTKTYPLGAWVHDMYEGSSRDLDHTSQPSSWAPDFYRPSGREADDVVIYKPLAVFMSEKAKDKGISQHELDGIRERYYKEVKSRYSDCDTDWRRWCVNCKTWKHFFGPEPFPGKEPEKRYAVDTHAASSPIQSRAGNAPSTGALTPQYKSHMARYDSERRETPGRHAATLVAGAYRSQIDEIEYQARKRYITTSELRRCFEEKEKIAETRFGAETRGWRKYFVEASVWGRFFNHAPFPGKEPARTNSLLIQDEHRRTNTIDRGVARGADIVDSYRPPNTGSAVGSGDIPIEEAYAGQEKIMEEKAKKLNIRSEFFQYLQRARDRARNDHPQCSRQVRSYQADLETWNRFFEREEFPGIQPQKGHTTGCIMKMKKKAVPAAPAPLPPKVTIADRSQPPLGLSRMASTKSTSTIQHASPSKSGRPVVRLPPVANEKTVPTWTQRAQQQVSQIRSSAGPTAATKVADSLPAKSQGQNSVKSHKGALEQTVLTDVLEQLESLWVQNPDARLSGVIVHNLDYVLTTKELVADVLECFHSDSLEKVQEIHDDLKARIFYSHISNGNAVVWSEPFVSGDLAGKQRGDAFLRGWIHRSMTFGAVKPSFYWKEMKNTMQFIQKNEAEKPDTQGGTGTAGTFTDLVLQAVEKSWPGNITANHATMTAESDLTSRATVRDTEKLSVDSTSANTDGSNRQIMQAVEKTEVGTIHRNGSTLTAGSSKDRSGGLFQPFPGDAQHFPGFEDAEVQWERYRKATGSSDLDCLVVEENAKAEGMFRMVLDSHTGQVISVEELISRTTIRLATGVYAGLVSKVQLPSKKEELLLLQKPREDKVEDNMIKTSTQKPFKDNESSQSTQLSLAQENAESASKKSDMEVAIRDDYSSASTSDDSEIEFRLSTEHGSDGTRKLMGSGEVNAMKGKRKFGTGDEEGQGDRAEKKRCL